MEAKFEIGNELMHSYTEKCGVIEAIYEGKYGVAYDVCVNKRGYNEHGETWLEEDCVRINACPRTLDNFLERLRLLLDDYNASIYVDFDQSDEIHTTTIAVGEDSVRYSHTYGIDTDNVLNYDK